MGHQKEFDMYDADFVQVLQASIAPCVMISGVGLLLLSFSNRLSRPLDRVRQNIFFQAAHEGVIRPEHFGDDHRDRVFLLGCFGDLKIHPAGNKAA